MVVAHAESRDCGRDLTKAHPGRRRTPAEDMTRVAGTYCQSDVGCSRRCIGWGKLGDPGSVIRGIPHTP